MDGKTKWVGLVSEYFTSLDAEGKARYVEKLRKHGINQDPLLGTATSQSRASCSDSEWIKDAAKWPQVEYGDIYNYLIDSVSVYTKESLKSYKGLEAYKYLVAGYVRDVEAKPIGEACGSFIVRAKVQHGQKQNAAPLQPWIIMEQNGQVHTGHCTCMAGLGEACSHIAAVLFFLMASWSEIQKTSCTSQPCAWLAPGSGIKRKGLPLCETDFTNPLTKFKNGVKPKEGTREPGPGPTDEEKEAFLQRLTTSCPEAAILKVWPGYAQQEPDPELPLDMASLYSSCYVGLPISTLEKKVADVLETLMCSEEQRDNAQAMTIQQSKCGEWYRLRAGRVTASNLKKVLGTDPGAPARSVPNSVCSGKASMIKTPDIMWGKQREDAALKVYANEQAKDHQGFQLQGSGLWVSCEAPYLAGSPDGLVECVCCGRGLVEVKCPYQFRDCTVDEFLSAKKCFMSIGDDGDAYLNRSHEYSYQVQLQMFVCDAPYCDFVVHTNKFTLVKRILRDSALVTDCLPKVREFMTKAVLPQLMAHHFA